MLFVRTDHDAPNRKVIAHRPAQPEPGAVEDGRSRGARSDRERRAASAAASSRSISSTCRAGCALFGSTARRSGESRCPAPARWRASRGREDSPTIFYAFTSPLYPDDGVLATIPASKQSDAVRAAGAAGDRRQRATRRRQMFATSKDGTRVPFFLTAQQGTCRSTAANPTMLYGYGGFSVSMLPTYRPDVPAWLELGGVWVTANMRGGAEYGEAWHKAGMLEKKQNVFDDFIAVAEYLVAREVHLAGEARRSWAARTAGCWSAR